MLFPGVADAIAGMLIVAVPALLNVKVQVTVSDEVEHVLESTGPVIDGFPVAVSSAKPVGSVSVIVYGLSVPETVPVRTTLIWYLNFWLVDRVVVGVLGCSF
jgi:hypothetical protein